MRMDLQSVREACEEAVEKLLKKDTEAFDLIDAEVVFTDVIDSINAIQEGYYLISRDVIKETR